MAFNAAAFIRPVRRYPHWGIDISIPAFWKQKRLLFLTFLNLDCKLWRLTLVQTKFMSELLRRSAWEVHNTNFVFESRALRFVRHSKFEFQTQLIQPKEVRGEKKESCFWGKTFGFNYKLYHCSHLEASKARGANWAGIQCIGRFDLNQRNSQPQVVAYNVWPVVCCFRRHQANEIRLIRDHRTAMLLALI